MRHVRSVRRLLSIPVAIGTLVTPALLGTSPAFAAAGDVTTAAGTGAPGYSGDGGPATGAQLNGPYGMGADGAGNVYIADCGNNVIRKFTPGGNISTLAGSGTSGYSGDGGPATAAELNCPSGVSADASGNVIVADTANHVVRKVTPGGIISTIAGVGGPVGFGGDGGPATAAQFGEIYRTLAVGSTLYIADYSNNRVRLVDAGGNVSTIAGDGSLPTSGDGGPATAAGVNRPVGLARDLSGNLYIVQTDSYANDNRVRRVNTGGTITTFAGAGPAGYSGDVGPATAARLNNPLDIVVDASGRALISDYGNNAVRSVDPNGTIHTVAGVGSSGYDGDGGSACDAHLNGPLGLALDPGGNLYVADNSNNVVRRVASPVPSCPAFIPGVVTDFDRDAIADIAVYRPSSGTWFDHPSGGGANTGLKYGGAADVAVPNDYDADHRADQAVYSPSTGLWAVHNSSGGDTFMTYGGTGGDLPVPADYDGDGAADIAIFRPSLGFWYVHRSSDSSDRATLFGAPGDIPVPGDYDGDGKVDKAVFRPSTGTWFVHPTSAVDGDYALIYGSSEDVPVPGDYDGDGKADLAVFRPSTGLWAVHYSGGGPDTFVTYGGVGGDLPVPADFDGDHRYDIAVFRASLGAWYVHRSTDHVDAITTFGISGDIGLPLAPGVRKTFFGQ